MIASHKFIFLSVLTSFLIGISMERNLPVKGNKPALLTIEPQELFLKPGENGQFSVWIRGIEDLYGAELTIRYNPEILGVIDSDLSQEGVQVSLSDVFRDGFIAVNQVDPKSGSITFAATRVNPAPPFQGEGELLRFSVIARTNGETDLTFDGPILANRDGMRIEFEPKKARVKVSKTVLENVLNLEKSQSGQGKEKERRSEGEAIQPILLIAAGGGILLFIAAFLFVIRALLRRES